MDQVKRLEIALKAIIGVCLIGMAKAYAEVRYYDGRIEARQETIEAFEKIRNEVNEKYGFKREET